MGCSASRPSMAPATADGHHKGPTSVFEFDPLEDIDGNTVDLREFKGKVRRQLFPPPSPAAPQRRPAALPCPACTRGALAYLLGSIQGLCNATVAVTPTPAAGAPQVLLIVNVGTASPLCHRQLGELQQVADALGPQGLEVLVFPR